MFILLWQVLIKFVKFEKFVVKKKAIDVQFLIRVFRVFRCGH